MLHSQVLEQCLVLSTSPVPNLETFQGGFHFYFVYYALQALFEGSLTCSLSRTNKTNALVAPGSLQILLICRMHFEDHRSSPFTDQDTPSSRGDVIGLRSHIKGRIDLESDPGSFLVRRSPEQDDKAVAWPVALSGAAISDR